MEWVLRSPEIHNTFSNLGFLHADGYHVNENCNVALETILHNILTEDKYLRTYRRSISFGQNVDKDLIPLLIHAKDDLTIDLLIRILVDLTIPIECLLSVEVISKTDFGRHTIFEINNLLTATKTAFTDQRATKVVIDFLKKNVDFEQKAKLSSEQCTKIINSLLLLRNILHIPEECSGQSASYNGSTHTIQNQILWNMFSHSLDKLLIKLMIIPDASKWAVTMVQLIALLYKDQHVVTLHKLLNMWLEASLSESSEDNESNTSPPDRGSEDSLPMLTSDPTSDSSDNGASGKSNDNPNSNNKGWNASSERKNNSENGNKPFQTPCAKDPNARENSICTENTNDYPDISENRKGTSCSSGVQSEVRSFQPLSSGSNEKKNIISETSDYGYGTQIENQESISTSSNDDELPAVKPVHQKSHNPKQRVNNKVRTSVTMQDRKRKKIVKRGKVNIINVQGLSHKTPTDDDIANILKEFTVDFLLKGYNSLVHTLHSQILTNMQLEIDTSHFFWLVTYFLKFATQIELDVEHVCSVLSYDVISYLTAEGVNLCEQFKIAVKLDGNDLKPNIRRLHLVVTAIREIIQAMEVYKKFSHVCKEDQETLLKLQIKICDTDELRSLFVLLLRHYNPKYHTKQYLQDLVLTNHILLTFLDGVVKLPQYNGTTSLPDHIKQFATTEIMYQYGLLLEDYVGNGEFVNDCIFTMMHHVGGELGSVIALFQPKILKTFTSIWKSEFEICEDWSDLIEYVINTFIKKPHSLQSAIDFRMDMECFEDNNRIRALPGIDVSQIKQDVVNMDSDKKSAHSNVCETAKEKWTETELSSLSWNYMQCSAHEDVIGEIIQLFKEDDTVKSRGSVIQQLLNQNIINKVEYEKLFKGENDRNVEIEQVNKEIRDDDISKVCEQFVQDGKTKFLDWVQKVLLDTCFAKICLEKRSKYTAAEGSLEAKIKWMDLGKSEDNSILSPISYHSLINNQSIPLVPWNCEQASICKDLKFLHLLHKLGFHMPVDSGKIFVRIPNFWTADFLYEIAGKILPIDKSKLRFSLNNSTSIANYIHEESVIFSLKQTKDVIMTDTTEKFYQIHKQKLLSTMKYTPMPGSTYIPHHQVLHKSEAGEVNKQNWLEVVKKSQEYKITLNLNSNAPKQREDEKSNVTMKAQERELVSVPLLMSNPQPSASISAPVNNFAVTSLVSTIMTVKQETLSSNVQVAEAECCNNNLFETASVASDLTRMYVSDEDEKPEVLVPPAVKVNPHVDEVTTVDSNNAVSNKRPRLQFFSSV